MDKLNFASSRRARVAERLRADIASRRWEPGAFIPTEEDLVRDLAVSRTTLRLALQDLEDEGVLVAQRGRGRVVAIGDQPQRSMDSTIASRTVVLLTSVEGKPSAASSGHDKAVEASVVDAVHSAGLHALVLDVNNLSDSDVNQVLAGPLFGLVVAHQFAQSVRGQQVLNDARRLGIPTVVHGDGQALAAFDRVMSDHQRGGYLVTRSLIDRGCKRILPLWATADRPYWMVAREQGHLEALAEAGIEPIEPIRMEQVVPRSPTRSEENLRTRSRQYAGYLVEHVVPHVSIDAIVVSTDLDVFPATSALRKCGVTPGKDILLGGYDNRWHQCWEREFEPAIPTATTEKHNGTLGAQLLDLLKRRIAGSLGADPVCVVNSPELIIPSEQPLTDDGAF